MEARAALLWIAAQTVAYVLLWYVFSIGLTFYNKVRGPLGSVPARSTRL